MCCWFAILNLTKGPPQNRSATLEFVQIGGGGGRLDLRCKVSKAGKTFGLLVQAFCTNHCSQTFAFFLLLCSSSKADFQVIFLLFTASIQLRKPGPAIHVFQYFSNNPIGHKYVSPSKVDFKYPDNSAIPQFKTILNRSASKISAICPETLHQSTHKQRNIFSIGLRSVKNLNIIISQTAVLSLL